MRLLRDASKHLTSIPADKHHHENPWKRNSFEKEEYLSPSCCPSRAPSRCVTNVGLVLHLILRPPLWVHCLALGHVFPALVWSPGPEAFSFAGWRRMCEFVPLGDVFSGSQSYFHRKCLSSKTNRINPLSFWYCCPIPWSSNHINPSCFSCGSTGDFSSPRWREQHVGLGSRDLVKGYWGKLEGNWKEVTWRFCCWIKDFFRLVKVGWEEEDWEVEICHWLVPRQHGFSINTACWCFPSLQEGLLR